MIPAALFCKEGRGSPKEVKNYSKKPGRPTAVPVGLPLTLKVRGHFEWAKKWLVENNSAPKLDGYDKMCDRFYSDGFTELEGIKIASHLPKRPAPDGAPVPGLDGGEPAAYEAQAPSDGRGGLA